jgi:RHS repeat-associated protein
MVAFAENKISPADVVDAVNRRLRKTISDGGLPINIPNGTIDCIWFGWQAMEERNPFGGTGSTDTPIRQYVWGTYIDECLQINLLQAAGPQSLPAGYYYLLQDTLYRAVALTNSAGSVVEAYDTDAYGNTLISTGPGADGVWFTDDDVQSNYGANSIIYCGYRYDPESENYYVRNRYYAPALGRWLTRDPIGVKGGTNLYAYVASSPVGKVDAWGEIWIDGSNLSPPSPAPPSVPKSCCPPFPLLVKTWRQWVAGYRKGKAMYSALVSQQRFAHAIKNDYATAAAELQHAEYVIQASQFDLAAMKFLGSTVDIEFRPAYFAAGERIMVLTAQYQGIGNDVLNLFQRYAKSSPPYSEVTDYIQLQRRIVDDAGNYTTYLYYC